MRAGLSAAQMEFGLAESWRRSAAFGTNRPSSPPAAPVNPWGAPARWRLLLCSPARREDGNPSRSEERHEVVQCD